jgi:nucleotide-binding universal stress UspA family protein
MVDLLVMTGLHDTDVRLPEIALEAALFETGRPVLLAPAALPQPGTDTAVVAWNGSLESTRAVAAAMPLLVRCKQLFVFCRPERHRPASDPAELLGYFAWHGLKAERLRVFQEHGGLGEELLAATEQVGAGLLVMGAYTHHRLRQMIVGGVTSHVLHHAKMPVLFAH